MSAYEPGTVAVGKVEGREARLLRSNAGWHFIPTDTDRPSGFAADVQTYPAVTDVRPLVVIDNGDWPSLIRLLRQAGFDSLPDQIEAQTKPPRIPEPGLWGVVLDGLSILVRHPQSDRNAWHCTATGEWVNWADIKDPTLVRDGIEDES